MAFYTLVLYIHWYKVVLPIHVCRYLCKFVFKSMKMEGTLNYNIFSIYMSFTIWTKNLFCHEKPVLKIGYFLVEFVKKHLGRYTIYIALNTNFSSCRMCYRIFDHTFLFQLLLLVLGFWLVLLKMFKNVHKNQMFIAKASMLPYKWRKM